MKFKKIVTIALSLVMVVFLLSLTVSASNSAPRFNKSVLELDVGQSETLQVVGHTGKTQWGSSDKEVAEVKDGRVVAKKPGTATIMAKISEDSILRCQLTVFRAYSEGSYKVGKDLPAGEYVLITISDRMGYFSINSDSSGDFKSIVANDNFTNRSIITVKNDQYLELKRCKAYRINAAPKFRIVDNKIEDGMYLIGVDIPAGEYNVIATGDRSGYLAVYSDSTHNIRSIVTNDNFAKNKYVTVTDGQYLQLKRAHIKTS